MASLAPQPHLSPKSNQPAIYRWLDLPRLFKLAILLVLLIPAIQPVTDPDFWWHLTTGNWILSHHTIPRYDLYTFTEAGHRWIAHEWLSQVGLAVLFKLGGLALVSAVLGLVTWLGFVLIWRAIPKRVNFLIGGLAVALGVAAANPILGARIQMITFALAALTYLWIDQFCEGRSRWLYALPAVIAVWANLHSGFFIAYAFLAIALVVEATKRLLQRPDAMPVHRLRDLALIFAACLGAALLNPNGWDIIPYALQTQSSVPQQTFIVEWLSPNFHLSEMRLFEIMVLLAIVTALLARRFELRRSLFLLAGLVLAFQSVRHIALFIIVAVPVLAEWVQQAWERIAPNIHLRSPRASRLTLTLNLMVLLTLAALVATSSTSSILQRVDGPRISTDLPLQAADFLTAHPPPGRMLNQFGWGGYLIWRLYPRQPVFIYGDAAVAGDQLLKDFAHIIYLSPEEPRLLERYDINWVIFKSDDPLITALRQNGTTPSQTGWFELGTFGKATILMRDTPENRSFAASARI